MVPVFGVAELDAGRVVPATKAGIRVNEVAVEAPDVSELPQGLQRGHRALVSFVPRDPSALHADNDGGMVEALRLDGDG